MDPILSPLSHLAGSGILGAMLVLMIYAYKQKDKQLTDATSAYTAALLAMQKEILSAVTKLSEVVDTVEKIHEREREQSKGRVGR